MWEAVTSSAGGLAVCGSVVVVVWHRSGSLSHPVWLGLASVTANGQKNCCDGWTGNANCKEPVWQGKTTAKGTDQGSIPSSPGEPAAEAPVDCRTTMENAWVVGRATALSPSVGAVSHVAPGAVELVVVESPSGVPAQRCGVHARTKKQKNRTNTGSPSSQGQS